MPMEMHMMSSCFKMLNCANKKQTKGKEVRPLVTKCRINAINKTCIIDIGCYLTTIPQHLVTMMMTKLIKIPYLLVNIVDDITYNPIALTNTSNHKKAIPKSC